MNTKSIRNGELANITPAGVLVICADGMYRPEPGETAESRKFCQAIVKGILAAARTGGYAQVDIFETLLAKGPLTPRIGSMARDVCVAAGDAALRKLFKRLGLAQGVGN